MRSEFFLVGIKAQRDQGCGRILLDENTGGGAVMLRPIKVQCFGVRISTGLPCIYKCIGDNRFFFIGPIPLCCSTN